MRNMRKTNRQRITPCWRLMLSVVVLLAAGHGKAVAQTPQDSTAINVAAPATDDDRIYNFRMLGEQDQRPEFAIGGMHGLKKYFESIKLPRKALKKGTREKVHLSFVIDKDGTILNPKLTKSVSPEADETVLQAVRDMPAWIPAIKDGKPVKMRYTFALIFIHGRGVTIGVPPAKPKSKNDVIVLNGLQRVDQRAEYPHGGSGGFVKYLKSTIQHPNAAKGISGIVRIAFTVEKDGSISDVKVVESLHPILDSEAVRAIQNMPKWKPAVHQGEVIRSRYTTPITFKSSLNDKDKSSRSSRNEQRGYDLNKIL